MDAASIATTRSAKERSRRAAGLDSFRALFVLPDPRSGGFQASIRGHQLPLADPDSRHELAPTPNDLLITSIASALAWTARRFLRGHELDEYVSVTAHSRTQQESSYLCELTLVVSVSEACALEVDALTTALERELDARAHGMQLNVHVHVDELRPLLAEAEASRPAPRSDDREARQHAATALGWAPRLVAE
jgi:uncharacterized OsmC-like protein